MVRDDSGEQRDLLLLGGIHRDRGSGIRISSNERSRRMIPWTLSRSPSPRWTKKQTTATRAWEVSSEATGPPLIIVGPFHDIYDYESVRNIFLLATITFRANFREKPFPTDVIFFIFSVDFF